VTGPSRAEARPRDSRHGSVINDTYGGNGEVAVLYSRRVAFWCGRRVLGLRGF
jgi:hypothetical protein